MKNNTNKQLRIEGLTPELLNDLLNEYPLLDGIARIEPEESSVAIDNEIGTLTLIVAILVVTTSGLNLATAIIKYLEAKEHKGNIVTEDTLPTKKQDPK